MMTVVWGAAVLGVAGCPGDPPSTGSGESSGGLTDTLATLSTTMADTTADTTMGSGEGTATAPTGGADSTGSTDPTGGLPGGDCNGTVYDCGDGEDNDGDGLVDLADPECVSPCDDDEGTFQTGLPGDGMDCKQDCFFDGNSGQGDDGCVWDLRCDPANPGAHLESGNCEYTGGNICDMIPAEPTQECVDFCAPFVPPGCDCWGCCEVQTDAGPIYIFLNSPAPCSLAQLDACVECTPQLDLCGNPCEPADCEICFGENEVPEGCDGNECTSGTSCEANTDCPEGWFCYLQCCLPPPPG